MLDAARRTVAAAYWAVSRFSMVGVPIDPRRPAVYVGAPHTSNWDFVLAVAVLWRSGVRAKVLMKKSFTDGPLGSVVRALGALPVDRENPGRLTEELVEEARTRPEFGLVLAPEGTRSLADGWRSGFYRITLDSGLPVVPVSVDGPSGIVRVGEARPMTGDVAADMDALREFFAGARGVRPGQGSPVRLRDETLDYRLPR